MNITIAGMGNAGTTIGADLAHKGHNVTLLKTSKKLHNDNYLYLSKTPQVTVECGDEKYVADIVSVTEDYEEAISAAEVIIIFVQTNYHKDLIKKIAKYLHDGQTIIIEPGYLSTCYFMQMVDCDVTIIEAESSPIDCRIIKPGHVKVLFKNVMNPFGVCPASHRDRAECILKQLKYPFKITKNVAEAALHNPNLIVHTIGGIFSIPRIEFTNGEYWMYREVFTPHIWNVVEALDKEKMDILQKLGCERLPYVEACKLRNSLDQSEDALKVFRHYAKYDSPKGPSIPDSRYITEDVSQGLVMLESFGKVIGVATPTATGLINCASAALNQDFRKYGRTIENLGLKNIEKILND